MSQLAFQTEEWLAVPAFSKAGRIQGWLGVRTHGSNRVGGGSRAGLIVLSVAAGSPADRAGLRPTDIIYAIDGQALHRPSDVVRALARREMSELAHVQFQRAGRWQERFIPVEPQPKQAPFPAQG